MDAASRIKEIQQTLEAVHHGWPFLCVFLDERLSELTEQLINNDNEQTRGQIKALRWVKELPASLQNQQEGMRADLSEQDSAD